MSTATVVRTDVPVVLWAREPIVRLAIRRMVERATGLRLVAEATAASAVADAAAAATAAVPADDGQQPVVLAWIVSDVEARVRELVAAGIDERVGVVIVSSASPWDLRGILPGPQWIVVAAEATDTELAQIVRRLGEGRPPLSGARLGP